MGQVLCPVCTGDRNGRVGFPLSRKGAYTEDSR